MNDYAYLNKIHMKYFQESKQNKPYKYKRLLPEGVRVIDEYTDIDSIAYDRGEEIVVANRGLDVTTLRDLTILRNMVVDQRLRLNNLYNNILIKEEDKLKKLQADYPDKKIVITGYSRGGKKAFDLGSKTGLEFHAFNAGDGATLTNVIISKLGGYLLTQGLPAQIVKQEIFTLLGATVPAGMIIAPLAETAINQMLRPSDNFLGNAIKNIATSNIINLGVGDSMDQIGKTAATAGLLSVIGEKSIDIPENGRLYKTEQDLVSVGYKGEIVPPNPRVSFTSIGNALSDHSLDHFLTDEQLDKIDSYHDETGIIDENTIHVFKNVGDRDNHISNVGVPSFKGIDADVLCKQYGDIIPECRILK